MGDAAASSGTAESSGGASSRGGSASTSGGASGSAEGSGGAAPEVQTCVLNSACSGTLLCTFGLCHAQCATAKGCPASQRCVVETSGNVCQLERESACLCNSDCNAPLICAVDRQCRNQCATDRDCITGQLCVSGVCANPSDVNAAGRLDGAADAG